MGSGPERKSLRIEIKDAEKGIVTAAFAKLEAKDYDDDWTPKGAFGEQAVRVSAYGHGSWMGELPVGKGTVKEVDGEAVAELKFFMSTQHGREHFEVVKEMGDLQQWSYGFDVVETGELTEELREKGVRRVLKKLKVHEVSPVLLGAGLGTRTLSVKALEDLLSDSVRVRFEIMDAGEKKGSDEDEAKQAFGIQSVIFPKSKWDSLEAAKDWASEHGFRIDKLDEAEGLWQFGQVEPDEFEQLRSICINPGDVDAGDDSCRVQAVGGPRKADVAEVKIEDVKQDDSGTLRIVTDAEITKDEWDEAAELAAMDVARVRCSSLVFVGGKPDEKENYALTYRDREGRINANAVRNIAARLPEMELPKEIATIAEMRCGELMKLVSEHTRRVAQDEAAKAAGAEVEKKREVEAVRLQNDIEEEQKRFQRNLQRYGR